MDVPRHELGVGVGDGDDGLDEVRLGGARGPPQGPRRHLGPSLGRPMRAIGWHLSSPSKAPGVAGGPRHRKIPRTTGKPGQTGGPPGTGLVRSVEDLARRPPAPPRVQSAAVAPPNGTLSSAIDVVAIGFVAPRGCPDSRTVCPGAARHPRSIRPTPPDLTSSP